MKPERGGCSAGDSSVSGLRLHRNCFLLRRDVMKLCQCKKTDFSTAEFLRHTCCDFLLCVIFLVYFRNEGSLTSTLRTLLFFTALMITLPVGLYFSSKAYVFEGTLGMSDRDSYFYAAIVAVVTVHVVLALFVYVAWNEGSRQWREGKQD
ncbi:PREDICTED: vacuolar ATPase assembly integral membrane protein VMA21 [Apaloderma vittatum]|nr:PREDICTED: vacuolar ATPase assembly integral membrane protein VMA21 [Apaloderma vittatum]